MYRISSSIYLESNQFYDQPFPKNNMEQGIIKVQIEVLIFQLLESVDQFKVGNYAGLGNWLRKYCTRHYMEPGCKTNSITNLLTGTWEFGTWFGLNIFISSHMKRDWAEQRCYIWYLTGNTQSLPIHPVCSCAHTWWAEVFSDGHRYYRYLVIWELGNLSPWWSDCSRRKYLNWTRYFHVLWIRWQYSFMSPWGWYNKMVLCVCVSVCVHHKNLF